MGPRDQGKGKLVEEETDTTHLTSINLPLQPDVLLDMRFRDSASPSLGGINVSTIGKLPGPTSYLYNSQNHDYKPILPTSVSTNTTLPSLILGQLEESYFQLP